MASNPAAVENLEIRRLFAVVTLAYIDKGEEFEQTGASTVIATPPQDGHAFNFSSEVDFQSAGQVSSVTLKLPNGTNDPMTLNGSGTAFKLKGNFADQSDLDQAFANGTYKVTVVSPDDGTHALSLDLTGNAYPNAPVVSNYDSLLQWDPADAQTVSWNSFTGGTTNDLIIVTISDQNGNKIFATPDPGGAGALNGTATSVQIPAGTLNPGTDYSIDVNFIKLVTSDSSDYPGVVGYGVYSSDTNFNFSTIGSTYDSGAVVVNGGAGNDSIGVTVTNGNYVVTEDDLQPIDFLTGGVSSIEIFGGAGNDTVVVDASVTLPVTLHGAGGADCLSGGSGSDMIKGGSGNDTELGNAGNDTCIGGIGDDSLLGGAGADQLQGGADNDTLLGGGGPDTLYAGIGNNSLAGGAGNDSLVSNNGVPDTLDGGAGSNSGLFDAGIDSVLNIQAGS